MCAEKLFQDFGAAKPVKTDRLVKSAEELEDLKLEAFENGYQAGWDDAVKAQASTLTHVSSGLATSLQEASFDYHEMRSSLNGSVQTILNRVVSVLLPQMARASLGAHICEQITAASRSALDRPIEVVVAPEAEAAVTGLLGEQLKDPFELSLDPLLAPSQVLLRLGDKETEINLDKMIAEIAAAIEAYFHTQNLEVRDG
ncbi:hypothetical protein [uncultured Tateyamaria sp.]|uniref:hypothetical protein n=1 Tax=uncultured Tateyamaria sp. TaxID=455651 RepID=UPI00261DE6E7|nr:hypothetical protein [uncultured Tateyamaria sp.]